MSGNQLAELNLTGATFGSLPACAGRFGGFCIDSDAITTLILDDAELDLGSFHAVVGETTSITDVSLDGMRFADETPNDLDALLGIETLDRVTVDRDLYELYMEEFDAFDALDGNTVTVTAVPLDCNTDGLISILDANCTPDHRLDDFLEGNGTLRCDLDGVGGVDFGDFITMSANFNKSPAVYTAGDLNKDGAVEFADFLLLVDNFDQGSDFSAGVAAAAVPEPSAGALLLVATGFLMVRPRPVIGGRQRGQRADG